MELTELEVRGQKVAVNITKQGYFTAEVNSQNFGAYKLEDLRQQLMTALKKLSVRVEIPATRFTFPSYKEPVLEDITLTGLHAKHETVLCRDHTGKAGTIESGWKGDAVYRRMTASEKEEFLSLYRASRTATQAFEKYAKPMELNAASAVRAAVAENMKKEAENMKKEAE